MLVVFLFLNSWRSTVITGLALPVSVLASFMAVWAFGFTLNTMSLLGLSLAIGILIDDAIVVRENIVRHVEMGKDHFRAAHDGTDEIGLAVAATTFSILAVFVPIAFMSGVGGQWFKPFALTIACSVLVSLFVSFSLDPMLSAYWPDPHEPPEERGWITRQLDRFNAWFNRLAEGYKGVIGWALDHRLAMVLVAIGTFVGSFTLLGKGFPGLLAVLAGIAVMLLVLRRTERPWYVKLAGAWRARGRRGTASGGAHLGQGGRGLLPARRPLRVHHPDRDPTRLEPGVHPRQGRRGRADGAPPSGGAVHVHHARGSARSGAVDVGNIYVRMVPKHERSIDAETFAAGVRDRGRPDRRGHAGGLHQRLQRRPEAAAAADQGTRPSGHQRRGGNGPARWWHRCRTRWTSPSRTRGRSPS